MIKSSPLGGNEKKALVLAIDVGTGTQDIFLSGYSDDVENCPQIIAPSPTVIFAKEIDRHAAAGTNIFLDGQTMGGGPVNMAIKRALKKGIAVFATETAARTIDDDLEIVASLGVRIADKKPSHETAAIRLTDVMLGEIKKSFSALSVGLAKFDLAVAVQDHGHAPKGTSDRKFRFQHLKKTLEEGNLLSSFYDKNDLPSYLTRMRSVIESTSVNTVVADTGIAAILGALEDLTVAKTGNKIVVNVGNGHTLAVSMKKNDVLGIFEHHTALLDASKMTFYLDKLIKGRLTIDEVFEDGGHGAFVIEGVKEPLIVITGPKRSMLHDIDHDTYFAAPYGDMMLSGCFGLVRGLLNKKNQGKNQGNH